MLKVGIRFKGAESSLWNNYQGMQTGSNVVILYESETEYTIVPLNSVDFIDVKEGEEG